MKKLIPLLMLAILVVTGCSNKEETKTLNLVDIEDKIAGLAYSVNDDTKTVDLIFKENMTVTEDYVSSVYGVNFENIEEFLINMPTSTDTAEMYAIVLPKSGKSAVVKKEMDSFISQYQSEYENSQLSEMTKNVFSKTYGEYLIYIISNKSETVYNTITGN